MLNRRSFLLGLGSGIIIGAILLQLFNLGQNSQEDLKRNIDQQVESASPDSEEQSDSPEQSPAATPQADAKPNEDAAEPSPATGEAASGALRLIRISSGMKLVQIAELLSENQIVSNSDAEQFVREMQAAGKKARAGYYAMPEGAGVEAVITAVTSQPLTKEEAETRVAEQQL